MKSLAQFLGSWVVDYYLLSTLLLVVVLIAVSMMRQPARKLAAIRATVVGLFLLAVLCSLPGWSSIHLRGPHANEAVVLRKSFSKGETEQLPQPARPEEVSSGREPVVVPGERSKNEGAIAVAPPMEPALATRLPEGTAVGQWDWLAMAGWGFLVGGGLVLSWLLVGAWRLGRLCRDSERAPEGVLAMFERLAGSMPLLPRLLVTGRLPSAVALGVWDPTILLPRKLADDDGEPLKTVLAHELAHVKNGDLRLLALSRLLMLLLWAHPLYWMLRVRMRFEQETLADASAAALSNPHDYAEQLVGWAREMPAAPHHVLASAVGIWEGPSQLKRRITLLLDDKFAILNSCSRPWRWVTGMLCTVLAVGLSLMTLRPAAAEEKFAEREVEFAEEQGSAPVVAKSKVEVSEDYQKILGHWEVLSVQGKGGRFMGLNDSTKPGDRIVIPHVRAPGADYEGPTRIYGESPLVTHWLSPKIQKEWRKKDSLHLYPDTSPKRCTYKSTGGDATNFHFSDEKNPPDFAIYRLDGDKLTLLMGDPLDFKINQGAETTLSSAGTPVDWKWKLLIPNYPSDFEPDADARQLRVTLKRVVGPVEDARATGPADYVAKADWTDGDRAAAATLEAYQAEWRARSGEKRNPAATKALWRRSLRQLLGAREQAKDPALRESLATAAVGYANSLHEYETSVELLQELAKLESHGVRSAEWLAELGGLYTRQAEAGTERSSNLEKAKRAHESVIEKLMAPEVRQSPRAIERRVRSYSELGKIAVLQHGADGKPQSLRDAAGAYRKGVEELAGLRELVAQGREWKPDDGGHGGEAGSYESTLERLESFRHDETFFAGQLKWIEAALVAPHGEEPKAIEKIAAKFLEAARQGDVKAARALVAPGSRAAGFKDEQFKRDSKDLEEAYRKSPERLTQFGESQVDGDWAAVRTLAPVDHPKHALYLILRKIGGAWKVHAIDDFRFRESLETLLDQAR